MKNLKGIVAVLLIIAMAFSFTACHKQGEVAISSGEDTITSAMYSYYLILADTAAKNLISEDTENYDTSAKGFDYLKQTIDGKKYSDYVVDEAIKNCARAIVYRNICKENNITLSDENTANAVYQAQYYWQQYGYSAILPANGVSYETYLEAIKLDYLADNYFKSLYGKEGEKAVGDDELQKLMDENYIAVYALSKDYSSETSPKVEDYVSKMEGYKKRLENGESFEKIYKEYNEIKDEDKKEETNSDKPAPKDEYISIVGSDKTEVETSHFETIKAMALGEIKIISDTEQKVVYLVVKKDINSDSYYRDEYLASDLLYLARGEEFENAVEAKVNELEYTVSRFAIGQFKVKNIYYGY